MALKKKEKGNNRDSPVDEELFVFGYACKLYRDDEKALFIDQGKHLIPWMGNNDLKIDRYDVRGTLSDLKYAEAPNEGFDSLLGLTDTEKKVEALCDEERYRALHTNEEEDNLYQEEELKRLEAAIKNSGGSYGQVDFKYESKEPAKRDGNENDGDTPFIPSRLLDIPLNMTLPKTAKENAVIEKTALFIYNQGPQMEILLKMKQADNPLFDFLSYEHNLHGYYRLVLEAVRSGRYHPSTEDEQDDNDEKSESDDEHYLHPSLAPVISTNKVDSAPLIPKIPYKPSANCAYSMLVSKLKEKAAMSAQSCPDEEEGKTTKVMPFVTPSEEIQFVIKKLASYVARNGDDFEGVVSSKDDPRFAFLKPDHIYRPYYESQLSHFKITKEEVFEEKNFDKSSLENRSKSSDASKNKITPVCFSIKAKEVDNIIEKSAFTIEDSSEDDHEGSNNNKSEQTVVKTAHSSAVPVSNVNNFQKLERTKKIMEKERIKDKLTAAVREKVASAAREKMIQLERKKSVAAFLKMLNTSESSSKTFESTAATCDYESEVESLPDDSSDLPPRKSVTLGKRSRSRTPSNYSSPSAIEVHFNGSVVESNPVLLEHKSGSHKSHKSKKKSKKQKKKRRKHSSSRKHKKHRKRSRSSSESSDSD